MGKSNDIIETPISRVLVDDAIRDFGIQDFERATIREVKAIAAYAENKSGVEFIKFEMGIPGLPASQIGVDAQVKALRDGIAHSYPDIQGNPELKKEASRFVKAFIGVDVAAAISLAVCGERIVPHAQTHIVHAGFLEQREQILDLVIGVLERDAAFFQREHG